MPHFGALLTDDVRVVIYDRNVFIKQATGEINILFSKNKYFV